MVHRGSIKWYNPEKGYGFITPEGSTESGDDVFLHRSAVASAGLFNLTEGQLVTYDYVQNDANGKYSAENLKLVPKSSN
ncbi:cold shock domain-containing protein [Candidatus Liberibacter asiaticus]|uniref:cold-shock protein n=1 Tax=Liberibacter asiaticus TaxID=34021 RepID=UPI00234B5F55|nr:cold shock domain-containing protein [Candidatus Liberibacter asiaticus]